MVGCEYVIDQKVNYVLDYLNFREYNQNIGTILKLDNSSKSKRSNNVKNR